jgi:hypothetical protein
MFQSLLKLLASLRLSIDDECCPLCSCRTLSRVELARKPFFATFSYKGQLGSLMGKCYYYHARLRRDVHLLAANMVGEGEVWRAQPPAPHISALPHEDRPLLLQPNVRMPFRFISGNLCSLANVTCLLPNDNAAPYSLQQRSIVGVH